SRGATSARPACGFARLRPAVVAAARRATLGGGEGAARWPGVGAGDTVACAPAASVKGRSERRRRRRALGKARGSRWRGALDGVVGHKMPFVLPIRAWWPCYSRLWHILQALFAADLCHAWAP